MRSQPPAAGRALSIAAVMVTAAAIGGGAQSAERRPAAGIEPIAAIIEAFRSHAIVGLGEGPHNNEQGHRFRLALIRDPRFAAVVNDIVVESGSARYQDAVDRFVRGEAVPETTLRDARENAVAATPAWDRPIYDELFRAVREVNASLPRPRQLRILLGDPPIDWDAVATADDYRAWLRQRDAYPAGLIQREVLARGRRALVVYGDGHLQARSERPGRSLAGILETGGTTLFTITSTFADLQALQPGVAPWRMPALAMLRGTLIGAAPYELLFGPAPPVDYFRANPRLEDHFDAVLSLGTRASLTFAPLAYPRCADPAYIEMRVKRMVLSGSPPSVADRLAQECAAARR
jgi:hypothetical protein